MSEQISLLNTDAKRVTSNLENYSTDIENSFKNMSVTMGKLSSALEGEVADSLSSKFVEFEEKFPVVMDNMKSYIEDFKNLVTSFKNEDKRIHTNDVARVRKEGEFINVNNQI